MGGVACSAVRCGLIEFGDWRRTVVALMVKVNRVFCYWGVCVVGESQLSYPACYGSCKRSLTVS